MAKRWTIPFVSRQSKLCRIDIYDPTWSGAVTELSTNNANTPGVAAEDPFYYEEDNDEDLLNVIRIKTGYINLIETIFGGLDDLRPTTLKSRYVEVYYDSTLAFRGYIQQQAFDNDWAAAPREVSLPVISVLGIADSLNFDAELPIVDNKIGYYMKKLIDKIESSQGTTYSQVAFPQVANCPELAGTIRPTVVTKENSMFSQAMYGNQYPYEGIKLTEFLEAVCNAYGWICHDLPDQILFTRFDHSGNYEYYTIANLATATNKQTISVGSTPLNITDYVEPCSDDANMSMILPLRSLAIKSEGEVELKAKAEYKHMQAYPYYLVTYNHNGNEEYLIFLRNVTSYSQPYYDITGSHLLNSNKITLRDNKLIVQNDGINVIDQNGTLRLVMNNMQNWASAGDTLATLYFYERPMIREDASGDDRKLRLKIELTTGDSLSAEDLGTYEIARELTYELWCGNAMVGSQSVGYYNNNYSVELLFDNVPNNNALRLVIKLKSYSSVGQNWPLVSFNKIELYYKEASYSKYVLNKREVKYVGGNGGIEDGSIDQNLSCLWVDSGLIGTHTITTASSLYGYLANPQNRLQISMRPKTSQSMPVLMAYINKLLYWQQSWRWRLIAISFHPWDDEYLLTMHHSTTIDS